MICHHTEPRTGECLRKMEARHPRIGAFNGTKQIGPNLTGPLFACPIHDGGASSPYATNPHFNRPRKG